MQQSEIRFQKIRDLSQVMSDSFDFIKQERQTLTRLILVYVLPFVVIYVGAQIYFQRNILIRFDLSNPESLMANLEPFYTNLMVFIFFGVFIQSMLAGTYYSFIEAYIEKGKDNFTLSDISNHFFNNSLLALGASLIITVLSLFGAMFCLLPGIYFANSLSLIIFIAVFQKKGISHAFSYSWQLVRTQWWNTLLINVLGVLIVYAIGLVFSIPSFVFGLAGGIASAATDTAPTYPDWYWALNAISSAITTIAMIIPFTFQAFQFFNLEERIKPKSEIKTEDLLP